jgi:hypothetical protein
MRVVETWFEHIRLLVRVLSRVMASCVTKGAVIMCAQQTHQQRRILTLSISKSQPYRPEIPVHSANYGLTLLLQTEAIDKICQSVLSISNSNQSAA